MQEKRAQEKTKKEQVKKNEKVGQIQAVFFPLHDKMQLMMMITSLPLFLLPRLCYSVFVYKQHKQKAPHSFYNFTRSLSRGLLSFTYSTHESTSFKGNAESEVAQEENQDNCTLPVLFFVPRLFLSRVNFDDRPEGKVILQSAGFLSYFRNHFRNKKKKN